MNSVMVPVNATDDMIDVGRDAIVEARAFAANDREGARAVWSVMIAAAPPVPALGGWRTMESAPKDGTWVLLYAENSGEPSVCAAFWSDSVDEPSDAGWYEGEARSNKATDWGFDPTHWQPLRAPDAHPAPGEARPSVEEVARDIYEAMRWAADPIDPDNLPKWVPAGNSEMQDHARAKAQAIIDRFSRRAAG